MSEITVTVLNSHGVTSHIEISLMYNNRYYTINQWDSPQDHFSNDKNSLLAAPNFICSKYSFQITADPEQIISEWKSWHEENRKCATPFTINCADAAQWFLTRFCNVPEPKAFALPLSVNHLALGITVPSFFKTPMTLPGRVMSNAIFHIEKQRLKQHFTHGEDRKTVARCTAYLLLFFAGAALYLGQEDNSVFSGLLLYILGQYCVKGIFGEANHYFRLNPKPDVDMNDGNLSVLSKI